MSRFARIEKDRGRKDAPHNITMAREELKLARTLKNMTVAGCAGIYNLTERQAEALLLAEQARREREGEPA